jgi:hypothetical protein
MTSLYPTGIDTLAIDKTNATPALNDHAQHHDDMADAINKIEAALGILPNLSASLTVRNQILTAPRPVSTIQAHGDRVFENNTNNGSTVAATYSVLARLMNMLGSSGVANFIGTGISSVNGNSLFNASYSYNGNRMFSSTPTNTQTGTYASRGGLKLIQMGYNDYPSFGGTPTSAQNAAIENALAVFISLPKHARKYVPGNFTYGAGWAVGAVGAAGGYAVDASSACQLGTNLTTASTITFNTDSFYAGDPLDFYFYSPTTVVNLMQFEARLNPAGANTVIGSLFDYQGYNTACATGAGGKAGQFVLRIPRGSVPSGANVIRLNPINITSSTNNAYFNGGIIEGKAPTILPFYVNQDSTAAAQVSWANARMTAAAAQFDNIITTDPTPIINNARYFSAIQTLNDLGHARLAQAIYESLGRVVTTDNAAEMTNDVS